MNLQTKKRLAVIVFTTFALFDMLLFMATGAVTTASAEASCSYNAQHGWHIVGGGEGNGHWYETQEECIAALNPTEVPTETATEPPTETETSVPTDLPTEPPTETPVVTETPAPTDVPTDIPTDEPTETPVVTATPTDEPTQEPTGTPEVTQEPTLIPTVIVAGLRGFSCGQAWDKIVNLVHKDEGYRFFDNPEHAYCKVWLLNRKGIDYNQYKLANYK